MAILLQHFTLVPVSSTLKIIIAFSMRTFSETKKKSCIRENRYTELYLRSSVRWLGLVEL